MKTLELAAIRIDGDTQARVSLDQDRVAEYAELMQEGVRFPPVVVFEDGSDYWLADGFHRYHAMRMANQQEVEVAILIGTLQEAQLFSFSANARHGLPMSKADIRNTIVRMLAHPISKAWANAEIARHVNVSAMTVSRIRASMAQPEGPTERSYRTADGKVVKVAADKLVTKKAEQKEPEAELDTPEPPKWTAPEPEEEDQRVAELIDTVNDLQAENQRLRDAIAIGQWDATEIEKVDVQETIEELRSQIKTLEIDNRALRDSRDMFQSRNAELMQMVKSLQSKVKKLQP